MKVSVWEILVRSLHDFRRTWPQLVVSDLMARSIRFIVQVSVIGPLLGIFLMTTDTGVVADADIASFLVHPTGLLAVLLVGAASLGILFVEVGQLMVIGFGSTEDRRVTWLDAFKYTFSRTRRLIDLAWIEVLRLLPLLLPFPAAIGALYWLLLRKYDINYYLTAKPPEFLAAAILSGLLLTVLSILIITRVAGWLTALLMVLFDGMDGRQAARAGREALRGHTTRVVLWFLAWISTVVLLSTFVTFTASRIFAGFVPRQGSSFALLVAGMGIILLAMALGNLVVRVLATSLFPLILVRLYRSAAGPGRLDPGIADEGTLGEKADRHLPGKRTLCVCALVLALVTTGGYAVLRGIDGESHVQIIAHRGGAAAAPENTMAAFQRAIAEGADWLEIDVQEIADGTVVVKHDRDFMRVAGVNLEVWQARKDDLASIDVGSYFDPVFQDQRVPALSEVLELAEGRVGLLIELKYYGKNRSLEERVVNLVEGAGKEEGTAIMSLDYGGVQRAAALRPGWTYGLLNTVAIGNLTDLEVDFLALNARAASYWMIRHAHRRGIKVYPWTINDPVQMSVMMSRGVDGIITDNVSLVREVEDLRRELSPLGRIIVWIAGETRLLRGMETSSAREDA